MDIHLSRPGGKRRGPYSLERINRDLAAGKIRGSDYWAWYRGLPEWVPLYSVPGVCDPAQTASTLLDSAGSHDTEVLATEASPSDAPASAATPETEASPEEAPAPEVAAGMPFEALEEIFILTTGDGPEASRSPDTTDMLERITGQDIDSIRGLVRRDVISHCDILEGLKGQTSTRGAIWGAMGSLRPELLQQAREGLYRICIRTFRIHNGDLVSVFLFYNKAKL